MMETANLYLACDTGNGLIVLKISELDREPIVFCHDLLRDPILTFAVSNDPSFDMLRTTYGKECNFSMLYKYNGEVQITYADFKGRIQELTKEITAYSFEPRCTLRILQTSTANIRQERNTPMAIMLERKYPIFQKIDEQTMRDAFDGCFDGGTERMKKELAEAKKNMIPRVKKILKNGDYMTVLWADGTKTIVKRAADEAESDYAAFTAALGIKCFGSNSALKRIVASAEEQGKKKKKSKTTKVREPFDKVGEAFCKSAVALIEEMAKLRESEYEQQKTDEWLDGIEKRNDNRS